MTLYIVRNSLDDEFINGEFNQNSIIGMFNTKDFYTLFHIVNDAVDAFTISFTELPTDTGAFFTRGDTIEFEQDDSLTNPITFESNLIEITESLASYLNEGADWKMWIMKRDKLWWSHIAKPYLLN